MEGLSSVLPIVILLSVSAALTSTLVANIATGPAVNTIVSTGPSVAATAEWERLGMVLDIGSPGAYDSAGAMNPYVLKDGTTYRMWYRGFDGGRNRILYATSADGLSWTKEGLAIDVRTPPYYFDSVAGQSVMKDSATYKMWFTGGFWSGPFGMSGRIYCAESADAVSWTIVGVALDVAPAGTWDGAAVQYPSVVRDASGMYWLFYVGWDGTTNRIGLATSTDGVTFARIGADPILDLGPAGSWEEVHLGFPSVVPGVSWTMMYAGDDGSTVRLGRATSADGVHWTKDADNPEFVAGQPGDWDDALVFGEALFVNGPELYMYYSGSDGAHGRVGLAKEVKPTATGNADCDPNTINLRSSGQWITCYLEPDPPHLAADVVAVTVRLDSWLGPVLDAKHGFSWDPEGYLVDHDLDGTMERLLKFDRQLLAARLTVGEHVFLIEGQFTDGLTFKIVSETIRVID